MDQIFSNIGLLVQFPIVNLKIVIDGIMIGALFALAAYGLALVWGVMNVKNLAQGDFVICRRLRFLVAGAARFSTFAWRTGGIRGHVPVSAGSSTSW